MAQVLPNIAKFSLSEKLAATYATSIIAHSFLGGCIGTVKAFREHPEGVNCLNIGKNLTDGMIIGGIVGLVSPILYPSWLYDKIVYERKRKR
jgi:hypothetical protein